MIWSRHWPLILLLGGVVASAGVWAINELRARREAAEVRLSEVAARQLVQDAFPDWASPRITFSEQGSAARICGWVHGGVGVGSLPFVVYAPQPPEFPEALVVAPAAAAASGLAEAGNAFTRQQVVQICDMDPARYPPDAIGDPYVDEILSWLWDVRGQSWVVIPVDGRSGFVAVARRRGGGSILSPVMQTEEEARVWIEQVGRSAADAPAA